MGLKCNTTYYWRVFARGLRRLERHQLVATSRTDACAP